MLSVKFFIDDENYDALFIGHDDMGQFMKEVRADGSKISAWDIEYVTPEEALDLPLPEYYALEMCAFAIAPGLAKKCKTTEEIRQLLVDMGYLK